MPLLLFADAFITPFFFFFAAPTLPLSCRFSPLLIFSFFLDAFIFADYRRFLLSPLITLFSRLMPLFRHALPPLMFRFSRHAV